MNVPESDDELAHRIAGQAGEILAEIQNERVAAGEFGWPLEQIGDATAHDLLVDAIRSARPDDGLLSEEGHDDGSRTEKSRAWIVDPLDGSTGFGLGNAEWAVHVALTVDGEPVAGAVSVPGMGRTGSSLLPPVVPNRGDRPVIVVTGRTRARTDGRLVADALGADLAACGSAGVKAMLVVSGEVDIYVHDAPLYEWDVCAPAAVARASGIDACQVNGERLTFNKRQPVVNSLLICRPEFTARVIDALGTSR